MKKIALLLLFTVLLCAQTYANPAHKGSVLMPQPDGTMVSVSLVGDEFYHLIQQ